MVEFFNKLKRYGQEATDQWAQNIGAKFEIEAGNKVYEATLLENGWFSVIMGSSVGLFSVRLESGEGKTFPVSMKCYALNKEEIDPYEISHLEDICATLTRFFVANVVMLYFASLTDDGVKDLAEEMKNYE